MVTEFAEMGKLFVSWTDTRTQGDVCKLLVKLPLFGAASSVGVFFGAASSVGVFVHLCICRKFGAT